MKGWMGRLNADPTDWLLESSDPSLRYLALTEVAGLDRDSSEAMEARRKLMSGGPVARILETQLPQGHWGRAEDFYVRSKYRGTIWNLHLLAELGADPGDERIHKAGEFVLRWALRDDGGFTHRGTSDGGQGLAMSCLTGNMVWALSRLGFTEDLRISRARRSLVELCAGDREGYSEGRCVRCRSGPVKVLKALSEVRCPTSEEVQAIAGLRERMVSDCLTGRERGPRPEWDQVWHPLFWNTDLVEMLDLLGRTGGLPPEAEPILGSILGKQDREGRWVLERSYRGRCLINFEPLGRPSRWATLRVLIMLKHAAPKAKLMVR